MGTAFLIGYGNTLCGDDAAGPEVAQRLEGPGIEVLAVQQLGPELAPRLAQQDLVLFIDASRQIPAGEVRAMPLHPNESAVGPLGHHLRPEALLALAAALYGPIPPCWLIEIGGRQFEPGDTMSEPVRAALPQAVALAKALTNP